MRLALVVVLGLTAVVSAVRVLPDELVVALASAGQDGGHRSSDFVSMPQDSESLYCEACEALIEKIEEYGCDAACDLIPPPGDAICEFFAEEYCSEIIGWISGGYNTTVICGYLGLCGSGCPCGSCVPAVFNKRCLSLPNHCPSGTTAINSGYTGKSGGASHGTTGGQKTYQTTNPYKDTLPSNYSTYTASNSNSNSNSATTGHSTSFTGSSNSKSSSSSDSKSSSSSNSGDFSSSSGSNSGSSSSGSNSGSSSSGSSSSGSNSGSSSSGSSSGSSSSGSNSGSSSSGSNSGSSSSGSSSSGSDSGSGSGSNSGSNSGSSGHNSTSSTFSAVPAGHLGAAAAAAAAEGHQVPAKEALREKYSENLAAFGERVKAQRASQMSVIDDRPLFARSSSSDSPTCLDGTCSSSTHGCCLTCF